MKNSNKCAVPFLCVLPGAYTYFVMNVYTYMADKTYTLFTCEYVLATLTFLIDNICIRFGQTVYEQTVGIPLRTNCAPLIAHIFILC